MRNFNLLIILFISSFVYAECNEINNIEECERVEWCEWIENENMSGGACYGDWQDEESDDWEDDEWDGDDWEDECRYLESEDECLDAGCTWGEEGCFKPEGDEEGDDWEDDEWVCEDIEGQIECEAVGCTWDEERCFEQEEDEGNDSNDNEGLIMGDLTGDNSLNILDVVMIVQLILESSQNDMENSNADMNQDGFINILDVVALVQAILGSRTTDATMIEIFNNNNTVTIEADGYVGAVQMTLSHGNDFSINLTNDAFVAESHTDNNQTTLMVVNPGTELFSANGEFEIVEIIAANSNDYIETYVVPYAISLGSAYPNPFNPSTSFDLQVGVAGHVSLNVYNLMGQVVGNLVNNTMDAGNYNITWDAANFSSGMYIVKAETANGIATQKVMLVK